MLALTNEEIICEITYPVILPLYPVKLPSEFLIVNYAFLRWSNGFILLVAGFSSLFDYWNIAVYMPHTCTQNLWYENSSDWDRDAVSKESLIMITIKIMGIDVSLWLLGFEPVYKLLFFIKLDVFLFMIHGRDCRQAVKFTVYHHSQRCIYLDTKVMRYLMQNKIYYMGRFKKWCKWHFV